MIILIVTRTIGSFVWSGFLEITPLMWPPESVEKLENFTVKSLISIFEFPGNVPVSDIV